MSDEQVKQMVQQFFANGGSVTRLKGKRLPRASHRMAGSMWTKGRKAVGLKDMGYAGR